MKGTPGLCYAPLGWLSRVRSGLPKDFKTFCTIGQTARQSPCVHSSQCAASGEVDAYNNNADKPWTAMRGGVPAHSAEGRKAESHPRVAL